MKLNFTNSKDGILRTVVRVEHRLAKDDLVNALALEVQALEVFEDLPENMPEAEVMGRIRKQLQYAGSDAMWTTDMNEEFVAWAQRQIDRVVGDV